MITIETHPNLSNWINLHFMGKLVDQFTSRAKALGVAKSLVRKHKSAILDLDTNEEVK